MSQLLAIKKNVTATHDKLLHVPLVVHIGQVWHHVGHDFEPSVFAVVKALAHGPHRVASGKNSDFSNHMSWQC